MVRYIALTFGYVETSQVGWVIYQHPEGFRTRDEALLNLTLELKAKYEEDELKRQANSQRGCCKKWDTHNFNWCPTCGKSMKKLEFEPEEFSYWLYDLGLKNCDQYGCDEYTSDRELLWTPWTDMSQFRAAKNADVCIVQERAEKVITDMLLELEKKASA